MKSQLSKKGPVFLGILLTGNGLLAYSFIKLFFCLKVILMSQAAPHIPVLLEPVLQAFAPVSDGVVVDGTFGAGGYTRALLKTYPNIRVIAFDRDETVMPVCAICDVGF